MAELTVLYYPEIEPPVRWLRSAALVFGTVVSFVPTDAATRLSDELVEFANRLPEAYQAYRPTERMGRLADVSADGLDRAFSLIARRRGLSPGTTKFKVEVRVGEGGVRVRDHVFLHESKISESVRQLLEVHGLILPKALAESFTEEFWLVDEVASSLILTQIAQSFAAQKGWSTLTDVEVSFSFAALSEFRDASTEAVRDVLAKAVVTLIVPSTVESMRLDDYIELRKRYSEIRGPFQDLIVRLTEIHRLAAIASADDLRAAIDTAAQDLAKEVEKLRESRLGRSMREWVPFSIGGLLSLAGAAVGEPVTAVTVAGAGVAVTALEKFGAFQKNASKDPTVRLLADLRQDIIAATSVRRWLS